MQRPRPFAPSLHDQVSLRNRILSRAPQVVNMDTAIPVLKLASIGVVKQVQNPNQDRDCQRQNGDVSTLSQHNSGARSGQSSPGKPMTSEWSATYVQNRTETMTVRHEPAAISLSARRPRGRMYESSSQVRACGARMQSRPRAACDLAQVLTDSGCAAPAVRPGPRPCFPRSSPWTMHRRLPSSSVARCHTPKRTARSRTGMRDTQVIEARCGEALASDRCSAPLVRLSHLGHTRRLEHLTHEH